MVKKKKSVKELIVDELHRPARVNIPSRAVEIRSLTDLGAADIAEFPKFKPENDGYRYLLVYISAASKMVEAEPLKTKSGASVAEGMRKILERLRFRPSRLWSDAGSDFFNPPMRKLMKEYNITHYHTFSEKKSVLAERVIKTLKQLIYKNFQVQGTYEWVKPLPDILKIYNGRVHRSTGMAPDRVRLRHEKTIIDRLKSIKRPAPRSGLLKPGTYVRLSKTRNIFAKKYAENWTYEIFKIAQRLNTNPVTYKINALDNTPILGTFHRLELQPTKFSDTYLVQKILKKEGDRCLYKWLGFDTPSWGSC